MRDVRQPLPVDAAGLGQCEQSTTWGFYELDYARREAQAEADLACEAWRQVAGADGYAVYRAAQDRADAAQHQLAACARSGRADP